MVLGATLLVSAALVILLARSAMIKAHAQANQVAY